MDEKALGYSAFWKRVSMKLALSEAARELGGVRASQLCDFEQGREHRLTPNQIEAYIELLDRKKSEQPIEVAS
jgi:hypothetical protein